MKSCLFCFVALAVFTPAQAQVSVPNPWSFELTPYFWPIGMSGAVVGGANAVEFDYSFDDIADFAIAVHFEADHGEWAILGDLSLNSMSGESSGGLTADVDQIVLEGGAGYELEPWLEVLFGARYMNTNVDFEQAGTTVGERNAGWLDPFIGARLSQDVRRWRLEARFDAGGALIGSDLAFNGYGAIGFRPANPVSLGVGYRVLDIDYVKDDGVALFIFDVNRHGPFFALTVHF
jgi:hypothetical protein